MLKVHQASLYSIHTSLQHKRTSTTCNRQPGHRPEHPRQTLNLFSPIYSSAAGASAGASPPKLGKDGKDTDGIRCSAKKTEPAALFLRRLRRFRSFRSHEFLHRRRSLSRVRIVNRTMFRRDDAEGSVLGVRGGVDVFDVVRQRGAEVEMVAMVAANKAAFFAVLFLETTLVDRFVVCWCGSFSNPKREKRKVFFSLVSFVELRFSSPLFSKNNIECLFR